MLIEINLISLEIIQVKVNQNLWLTFIILNDNFNIVKNYIEIKSIYFRGWPYGIGSIARMDEQS